MENPAIKKIIASGVCLALAMLLPFLTFQSQQLGRIFSLMHIPIFIAAFICGWKYGVIIGILAPIIRSISFGLPPLYPTALSMAIELAIYGALAGLIYERLHYKKISVYPALICAIIIGRSVGGLITCFLMSTVGNEISIVAYIINSFTEGLPGIICHIAVVPPLVYMLKKMQFIS